MSTILDDVKTIIRKNGTAGDVEPTDLIAAVKADLALAGIKKISETDPLIKQSIYLYAKAHYGYDNPEAARFLEAYEKLKIALASSSEYTTEATT